MPLAVPSAQERSMSHGNELWRGAQTRSMRHRLRHWTPVLIERVCLFVCLTASASARIAMVEGHTLIDQAHDAML
jgi:hypothetical protein